MSWLWFLKVFIDEDHSAENQKHSIVSLNTERFIWANRMLEVGINQVSLKYIVMR